MEKLKAVNGANGVRSFMTSSGVIVGQGKRTIKNGLECNHLIDTSGVTFTSSFTEGDVNDTVLKIKEIIKNNHGQVSQLAKVLKRNSLIETCEAVWDFVFHHIQYKSDKVGVEQLSTPARIWLNRSTPNTPSDCDDHTIFCGSLLYCLGIPFSIRIAGYDNKPFSHVYIVAEDSICIDTVLHRFNVEAPFSSKKDSKMTIETLQGLDGQEHLGELGELDESIRHFANTMEGLKGLGDIDSSPQEEAALRTLGVKQLGITLKAYQQDPAPFHALGYKPAYFEHVRKVLKEMMGGSLEGITIKLADGTSYEQKNLSGLEGLSDVQGLGFLGWFDGWFKKLRKGIKKVAKKVKKVVKKTVKVVGKVAKKGITLLNKINPLFMAVRGGILLAIKKNFFGLALKFGFGLLTKEQAISIGCDLDQWAKSVKAYGKFADKFRFLGGRTSKLRTAIKKGYVKYSKSKGYPTIDYKSLKGFDEDVNIEIGVLPAVAIPAATGLIAKAMTFLKPFLLKILKGLHLDKMFAKLKAKHIENLKDRKEKATTVEERHKLDDKIKRAENNLVVINNLRKKNPTGQTDSKAPSQTPELVTDLTESEVSTSQVKTAGMGKLGMAALVLFGVGTMVAANKKKSTENKSNNPKK
ncbi:hypothetical protein [Ancylomarina sp.]|uniref:hypothetical protein n=1 Tax=Ancylomarina sp. TaxID=1970196 RepID=UPI003568F914